MSPGTRLKAHWGPVNWRLYCHLGLIAPGGADLRVGNEPPRSWQEGKTLCFDDSYVHEAWNNGSEARCELKLFDLSALRAEM